MIIDFLRKLFAGMPTAVTTGLGALGAAVAAVIANTLLNISQGGLWSAHIFLLALAGAVAKVLLDLLGSAIMPKPTPLVGNPLDTGK